MQKINTFLCCLFLSIGLFAQDTIVVQTLTWGDDFRSGVYTFPTPEDGPFERILMRYNMRCHDAAVGSGNVGCREWDYSCNTFLTDSTRSDSTQRLHPNYLISSFDNNTFNYTTSPVYTYYQYQQQEAVYNNTISETTTAIGDASTSLAIDNDVENRKIQLLFTAAELTDAGLAAGDISGLRLNLSEVATDLNFLRLSIKHTNQSVLSANTLETNGFEEVYFLNTPLSVGEQSFNFTNNFNWNGTSNILVEANYKTESNSNANIFNASTTSDVTTLYSGNIINNLNFAGASKIDIPISDGIQSINNEITISFWTYGNEDILPVNNATIEGKDDNGNRQIMIHLPWGSSIYWDCGNDGSGYDRIEKNALSSHYEGQWTHWTFTKNAQTGEMFMYRNGQVYQSGTGKTRPIDITSLSIGAAINGNNPYYGLFSDIQIYNKALDITTIQEWYKKELNDTHPDYSNLVAWYPLQEGSGSTIEDQSSYGATATISGAPEWVKLAPQEIFRGFNELTSRPDVVLVQGTYEMELVPSTVLDSTLNTIHQVRGFEVSASNNLEEVTVDYYWQAGTTNTYDEMGNIVNTTNIPAEGTIEIEDLTYFQKQPAVYELLSLVTPYGNGLDLGEEGKTFTFDVTDFMPVLQGDRRIHLGQGGEWQEELDIKFLFIKGTPVRDVKELQNIWPRRGGTSIDDILADKYFEPRMVPLAPSAEGFRLKTAITGHGQNGEFISRDHYLNLDGGSNDFEFSVWKECADNPIYPQGGTWIFDRAGWCPGMETDVHQYEITDLVSAGGEVEIDYGILGNTMSEARYITSHQLVTYGAPNFATDAMIEDVIRPSKKVEHERFNPICQSPQIVIKNTGSNALTSATITYQVRGGMSMTYDWTGNLAFLETAVVDLPIDNLSFWNTDESNFIFDVSIETNGDEYANNNGMESAFETVYTFDEDIELFLEFRTNNRASENSYTIKDSSGDVVMERSGMTNSTTYKDDIILTPGCYTLEVADSGDDGLDFWYWAAIGENVGSGYAQFKRRITPTLAVPVKSFNSDFGDNIRFDFIIPGAVNTDEITHHQRFSVFPNPAQNDIEIELTGFDSGLFNVDLVSSTGQTVQQWTINHHLGTDSHHLNLPTLPNGVYFIKVVGNDNIRTRQLIIQH